ncbi:MAG: hypothetical protein WBE75_07195 [Candidatus Omnitrophota bacterium]
MRGIRICVFFASLSIILPISFSAAEQVVLENGRVFEGNIVSRSGDTIEIEQYGVVVPYLISEIKIPVFANDEKSAYYENKGCGFSISWPTGWEMHEVDMGNNPKLLLYAYVADPYRIKKDSPRIYVTAWRANNSLEDMGGRVIADLLTRSISGGLELQISSSLKTVTVNEFPAITFTADFNELYDEWEKVWMRGVQDQSYLLNSNGIMILLDFICHKDTRGRTEWRLFEKTLNSIQLIPHK